MNSAVLETVRQINRHLPFAEPIAQTFDHVKVVWLPAGSFDPKAPTMRDLEGGIDLGPALSFWYDE